MRCLLSVSRMSVSNCARLSGLSSAVLDGSMSCLGRFASVFPGLRGESHLCVSRFAGCSSSFPALVLEQLPLVNAHSFVWGATCLACGLPLWARVALGRGDMCCRACVWCSLEFRFRIFWMCVLPRMGHSVANSSQTSHRIAVV